MTSPATLPLPADLGLSRLFGEIREAAIVADVDTGRVVLWNPVAEQIFGYTAAEALHLPLEALVPDHLKARHCAGFAHYRATGRGRLIDAGRPLEVPAVRKDGAERTLELTLSPIEGAPSSRRFVLALVRDVTDRREEREARVHLARERAARAEAEAARDAAERAVHLRDEFLNAAAHELKTPVASVKAYAQLVNRRLNRSEAVDLGGLREQLWTIDQQAGRLARLVEQLLDVPLIDAGRLEIQREAVDVGVLVERVAASVREQVGGRIIAIQAPMGLKIPADSARLEQVVLNLLDNAVKYSPTGEPIEVTVEKAAEGEHVRIVVRDRGIGIPPAQRERLFERFHQAHDDDRVAGLGLGLHVAHQVVEAHGGRLEAVFPPDGGSCFVVSLPLCGEGGDSSEKEGY
jgi:PAS domain S-box-containing protein